MLNNVCDIWAKKKTDPLFALNSNHIASYWSISPNAIRLLAVKYLSRNAPLGICNTLKTTATYL